MILLLITTLVAAVLGAPMQQSISVNDDGSYKFYYETGEDAGKQFRSEERQPDGVVIGKYSYEDPNGDIREVSYRADESGYVANGDVSVEGAPKGQFPTELGSEDPPQPDAEEQNFNATNEEESKADTADLRQDMSHKEEEVKDLPQEEPSANDPPEAFPEGFFLQNFQGLRRLPEPTPEESSTTAEPTNERLVDSSVEEVVAPTERPPASDVLQPDIANTIHAKSVPEMQFFMHLRPFQGVGSAHIDAPMHHQPVYVFSYQHPNSYGYSYYF